ETNVDSQGTIEVSFDGEGTSQTRNGWTNTRQISCGISRNQAYIGYVSKARGVFLNATSYFPVEAMDALALEWCRQRNLVP
ncbi:hypothetical protein ACI39O_26975, partial [Klebsiella pneumoniae]|uniref:hypothetical protein n=1 Tax=Klebsiella pneumoniae TaxID=573 RepID=UPI0038546136